MNFGWYFVWSAEHNSLRVMEVAPDRVTTHTPIGKISAGLDSLIGADTWKWEMIPENAARALISAWKLAAVWEDASRHAGELIKKAPDAIVK